MGGVRMAVVWCPDWPVIAWGVPLDEPAAVVEANRVEATSPTARAAGVRAGQRRRDALSRCPDLAVLNRDADREARLFEPVAVALEAITPRIEVAQPGLAGFPTRGPSRFFGGDEALAQRMLDEVTPVLAGRGEARVGVADGIFAARLAACSAQARAGPVVVPPGGSAEFLTGITIEALRLPDLVGVLRRLGLHTLGVFAALPVPDVVGRFGREGQIAHRLARGEDEQPPNLRRPAPDLAVTWRFEPPAEQVEGCAFVAKMLADDLHAALDAQGLACTRVAIEVETENGQVQVRLWRHEGALSAPALADRTRWQLDGSRLGSGPESGIVRLTLVPDEVVAARGRQLSFWGDHNRRADDVTRVVARLQGLLGPEAVTVPERRGALSPADRVHLVPAAAVDLSAERPATQDTWVAEPWPSQVPPPAPARTYPNPVPVDLLDQDGQPIGVTGRGEMSGHPAVLLVRAAKVGVTAWAGPWPAHQRWWDPPAERRQARLQVTVEDGSAHLLVLEHQRWWIEATYD